MFSKLQNKINIETLTENHSLNETLRETWKTLVMLQLESCNS